MINCWALLDNQVGVDSDVTAQDGSIHTLDDGRLIILTTQEAQIHRPCFLDHWFQHFCSSFSSTKHFYEL